MGFFFRRKKPKQLKETPRAETAAENQDDSAVTDTQSTSVAATESNAVIESETILEVEKSNQNEASTLDSGLSKSSSSLLGGLSKIFSGSIEFDEDLFEDLEDTLIGADIGVNASMSMIDALRKEAKSQKLKTAQSVVELSLIHI